MTEICFWSDGSVLCGFTAQGHTGFAQAGEDIVCAALSSALYLTANTITEIIGAACDELQVTDGEMKLMVAPADRVACQTVLQGLQLHLQELSSQYPDEIRLIRRKK